MVLGDHFDGFLSVLTTQSTSAFPCLSAERPEGLVGFYVWGSSKNRPLNNAGPGLPVYACTIGHRQSNEPVVGWRVTMFNIVAIQNCF